jgi:trafficking protein particle complex subunit 11
VQVEPDASDAFLIAGQRKALAPTLLPGAEAQLMWSLIPMECGFVRVPKIQVIDKRKAGLVAPSSADQLQEMDEEGTPVRVFDLRREERAEVVDTDETPEDNINSVNSGSIGPVLVLP